MPIRIKPIAGRYGLGSAIQFPNQPLIDCRLAEPLARWVGEVVAPVFAANRSSPLTVVQPDLGYEYRNRNQEATDKIIAHAIGLALDIFGFELANGRTERVSWIHELPRSFPETAIRKRMGKHGRTHLGWLAFLLAEQSILRPSFRQLPDRPAKLAARPVAVMASHAIAALNQALVLLAAPNPTGARVPLPTRIAAIPAAIAVGGIAVARSASDSRTQKASRDASHGARDGVAITVTPAIIATVTWIIAAAIAPIVSLLDRRG